MSSYEQSSTWKRTLGEQSGNDPHKKNRELLRVAYGNFREKATHLANEIPKDLPDFTVHDITHIDALWEYTDLIIGDDYPLNPAEAFVLGGAFLIHDLGMGLAAYPDGINELKKNDIWKDTAASLFKKINNRLITESDYNNLDSEIGKQATANTLRILHAKHAEKLAKICWRDSDDTQHFLIDDVNLRETYGTIVGKIDHSHWQSVEELLSIFKSDIGVPSYFPNDWTIDPLKLACMIRVVDAAQIDDRRAPSFLRALRKPAGVSESHWNFQQKMFKPHIRDNRLVYTSKSAYTLQEIESWWVCYDTLCMIDKELRAVDSLLIDKQKERFKVNGVASVENTSRLTEHIEVTNWVPTDTNIRVGNVPRLVHNLGGKQLYGDNPTIPLRELVQNSSDAIRARRILEQRDENFGDIIIRFGKDNYGEFIEVEDNGIGMSQRVLKGPFLDFGESFWGTSLMHSELPGLESEGYDSTGQYGIGFFSVFMWGHTAHVYTRKYNVAHNETSVLEFHEGTNSRPILRVAKRDEYIRDGGTRVRVWIDDNSTAKDIFKDIYSTRDEKVVKELIEKICPALSCNLHVITLFFEKKIITANDWLSIRPIDLIKRVMGISTFDKLTSTQYEFLKSVSEHMKIIKNGEMVYGRAFIYKGNPLPFSSLGCITVGGMRSSDINGINGIICGRSIKSSRDEAVFEIPDDVFKEWLKEQAELLFTKRKIISDNKQITQASVISGYGGHTTSLKIALHRSGSKNYEELKELITEINRNGDHHNRIRLYDLFYTRELYSQFKNKEWQKPKILENYIATKLANIHYRNSGTHVLGKTLSINNLKNSLLKTILQAIEDTGGSEITFQEINDNCAVMEYFPKPKSEPKYKRINVVIQIDWKNKSICTNL